MSVFRPRPTSVLMPIPAVQSAWYPAAILRETRAVLDGFALSEIDRWLCNFFALEPPSVTL